MKSRILQLKRVAFALLVLLLNVAGVKTTNAQSTVGTDFWVTFLPNHDGNVNLSLIAAGATPCSGTVTNPYTDWSTEFTVSVGATTIIEIPLSEAYSHYDSDCVINTGLHIVTTDSISLFASNFKAYTFDVTDVLPTYSLGSNYIIQTYNESNRGITTSPSSNIDSRSDSSCSEFTVLAVEDNTTVYITLTDNSSNGHYANQPFSVTLNAGQCYQIMSINGGDFSGSQVSVSGNKRVSVFAGNRCTNVLYNCGYCDHIVEQMMPVSCWGNHFVVTNSAMRTFDVVRVTAENNGCQVFINNSLVTTINQKQTYQFEINSDDPSLYLETSEPAMVYLYYVGSDCAGENGDPSMVLISPIEQRMDYVTFSTFNSGVSQYHFVNVITNTEDVNAVQLDGNSIASEFQTVSGNSGYSFARVAIEHGSHTLSTTGDGFVAHVYGLGDDESYAYSVGSNAVQELYTNMLVNGQTSSDEMDVCGQTVNFDLNYNYNVSQVNWTFGDGQTGSGIPFMHEYANVGDYPVTCDVYKLDGNGNDSLVGTFSTLLHIYESYYTEFVETALDYYTWEWTGETYYESGDYSDMGQTIHGCDSIVTLHLTINHEINASANSSVGGTVNGAGIYEHNSLCTLIAIPNSGYMFTYWTDTTGRIVSSDAEYTFTVTESRSLTAYFLEDGSMCPITFDLHDSYGDGWNGNYLVVSLANGPFIEYTVPSGSNAYYSLPIVDGSSVSLSWIQGSYIGECSFTISYSNGNRIYYGHNMNSNFTHIFDIDCQGMPTSVFDITTEANPWEGGSTNGAGTYNQFETCTLTATASTGYHFINWMKDGEEVSSEADYIFTVMESGNYTANFELNSYEITASANPTEGGTVTGGGTYTHFETCTLTATPNEGYVFAYWTDETGLVVTMEPEYSFTVTEEKTFVAKFMEEGSYCNITFDLYDSYGDGWNGNYLVVNYEDNTYQRITFTGGSYAYYTLPILDGSPITLTWIQGSYIGECSFTVSYSNGNLICYGQNLSSSFTFDFDVDCEGMPTSVFDITVEANPEEGGSVSGAGTYNQGETCTLTASDYYGYHFINWTKDGEVVSTAHDYSFIVNNSGNYVANFGEGGYSITAITNPATAGTVTGEGEYYYGETCTLTATPVDGYLFQSWNKNGEIVSTSPIYGFEVTESAVYEAMFSLGVVIGGGGTATNSYLPSYSFYNYTLSQQIYTADEMGMDGLITSIAFYNGGSTKTRNYNFYMVNTDKTVFESTTDWIAVTEEDLVYSGDVTMETGTWTTIVLDTPFAYSVNSNLALITDDNTGSWSSGMACRVFDTDGYQAIRIYSDGTNYDPYNPSSYNGTLMTVKNQIVLGMESASGSYVISATANPTNGGTVSGAGTYPEGTLCTLTANANPGYSFVNWTKNDVSVSTNATYSFTVTENASYVANFSLNQGEITQTTNFVQGWNWWSTYIEQEGIDGLTMLEQGLGSNGYQIKSQTDYVTNYGSSWMGTLNSINNEETYMLNNTADCQVVLTGISVSPTDHPITIHSGWNWIGYPCTNTMSVTDAFAGYTPANNDQLKSQNGYAMYYSGMWIGRLQNITPGTGLLYLSNNGSTNTLVYPEGGRSTEIITSPSASHWTNDVHTYPNNMTVLAVVELDDEELSTDNYELSAFDANGECRGSVKLTYVEPLNRQVAFLTIAGDEAAELSFALYDSETGFECFDSDSRIVYVTNAIIGSPEDPFVIRFRSTTGIDEIGNNIQIFPNPAQVGERINILTNADGKQPIHVEILNVLGATVSYQTFTETPASFVTPMTAGVYMLRIHIDGSGTYCKKLIIK